MHMAENYFMGLDGFVWFTGVVEDRNDPAKLGRVRVRCLEIHTEDKVMRQGDFTDKELDDFMDSFNSEQFERLMEFFNSMPKVRHEIEVKNSKTKKKSKVLLEGLDSFF